MAGGAGRGERVGEGVAPVAQPLAVVVGGDRAPVARGDRGTIAARDWRSSVQPAQQRGRVSGKDECNGA